MAVLGDGSGGYVGALRDAQLGAQVVLLEENRIGGVCLNLGCIPTKALLRSAEVCRTFQRAEEFGLKLEGTPIILSNAQYRDKKPVTVHIVISRLGDRIWYLGTSFRDAKQAVAWYKKRFWIEEMFRDLKSTLGLRQAHLKDEDRLTRLLLGYQIAYLLRSLIGFEVPKRWHKYFSSRPRLSIIWMALRTLDLCLKPRHRRVWQRHIWPALWLESG